MSEENIKESLLSSGKILTVRPGKGRDMINAMRKAKTKEEITFALTAELITIDGSPVLYEDLLEMDLGDVVEIQEAVNNSFLSSPTPKE